MTVVGLPQLAAKHPHSSSLGSPLSGTKERVARSKAKKKLSWVKLKTVLEVMGKRKGKQDK